MLTLRYELQEQIRADAEGVAYRASDPETREAVEVRLLRPGDDLLWPQVQKRCRLSKLMKVPCVRRVRELEFDGERPFVVLDPPPAHTLHELVESRRPLPFDETVRVLHAIAVTLVVAHRVGLSHGRLTAESVGWSAPIEEQQAFCVLDFTRCPDNPRADRADDIQQLSELWVWLLGQTPSGLAGATPELERLFHEMQSSEPADRPSAESVARALQTWMGRNDQRHGQRMQVFSSGDETGGVDQTIIMPGQSPPPGDSGGAASAVAVKAASNVVERVESKADRDPLTGRETLGRFKLLNKLGEGGMGAVWRAEDPASGGIVAIKVLRRDVAAKPEILKRFHREARLLAEVNNPWVANMLEMNADGDLHYLVLEFVEGSNLRSYLRDHGKLTEREALSIGADVARGLRDAHEHGIVHRDLKPENILLYRDADGSASRSATGMHRVKLTDFGLARHVEETESMHLSSAGAVIGTPFYFAPEQCSGKGNVDIRADVYSLGATLFTVLVGHPPFEAPDVIGLIAKHVNEQAPRLRSLVPELSEAIDEVVAKCLQKNPATRYQNAGELLQDLERLLRGEPTGIVAHPQLPVGDARDVLDFDFVWELKNPPHLLWPHVTNTERLNRAIGLSSVDYTTEANPTGGSRRFGKFRKLGISIAWQEHPFEWIEGRRMGVLREFKEGPWTWFTSVVEMTPRSDGGTTLAHHIRILPANIVGRTVAKIEVGLQSRKALNRVYRHIDAVLSGEMGKLADPFDDANTLSADGSRKLERRLRAVVEHGGEAFVVERLGEYLAEAPIQELGRIRPLALARRLSLDEKQLLTACLIGAREGLFTLLWDILCPICRIPSQVKDSLKAIKEHGQCEACQSEFALDFANSIELIFRIAADIQPTDTGMYCIGGPAHSPHVAAQVRLAPAERFQLDLALPTGSYRLRGPQLPYLADFRVLPDALATRWDMSLARGPLPGLPRQLKPGQQVFVLTNDTPHEIVARIERMASRSDAYTAARAAANPLFRELFPGECLAPDQLVQVEQVTLLFTRLDHADDLYFKLGDSKAFARLHDHFRLVDTVVRREGGSLIKIVGEGTCAVFTEPVLAIRAALAMRDFNEPDLRVAIHRGPAMVATINDHLDYFGSTVSATTHLLNLSAPSEVSARPRILMSDAIAGDPGVVSVVSGAAQHFHLKPISAPREQPRNNVYAHELAQFPQRDAEA